MRQPAAALFLHNVFNKAHQDRCDLRSGGVALRQELAVGAVDDLHGDRPVEGVLRISGNLICIREALLSGNRRRDQNLEGGSCSLQIQCDWAFHFPEVKRTEKRKERKGETKWKRK